MTIDDSLTQRKSDPRSVVLFTRVKALEDLEDLVLVVGVDADSVVGDRYDLLFTGSFGRDLDSGWRIATVFDGVLE